MNAELRTQLAYLPDYLGQHMLLSFAALGLGILISLPLALALTQSERWRRPVVAGVAAIQTIPALALLALMVPLFRAIGFAPALAALTLYSMLPMVRNTITGIADIDPRLLEAGRGLGLTERQLLFKVQLPLAVPVIVAGIRTAAVWVVGMATLSTPVGATSLGNYIFSGLQTQNYTAVLVGCVAAAVLALTLDQLIRLLEAGLRRRERGSAMVAATLLAALVGIAVALTWQPASADRDVRIGAKTFTEQYILARLIATRLESAGFPASVLDSLGSAVAFDALTTGRIDTYVDYSGTIWANYMGRTDNPGRAAITAGVADWLATEHGVAGVIPLGFENSYALAVRRADAEALGLKTIADLASHAGDLRLAADYEFFGRPEWASLQLNYGLAFAERLSMDSTLMYQALQAGEVDVITAFSTDGRIAAYDLVVLADPREALPPYDALLLVSGAAVQQQAGILPVLAGLRRAISNEQMRAANRLVDLDGASVAAAVTRLEGAE
ncbi:MAG: ABC transporter permease/substrate-binding protein [Gammaproteobacteria bacterium]|jgi:osmoprotectant transport system permease protein|nr:ABC transporter permease/substrate-binding protein [Gammaproteobacteria bacterium]